MICAAAIFLAACADDQGSVSPGQPGASSRPAVTAQPPRQPVPPGAARTSDPAAEQPAGQRVVPERGLVDVKKVSWNRVEAGGDARSLIVYWGGGASQCFGLDRIDVEREDDGLVVTVYEGRRPQPSGRPCPEILAFKNAVVRAQMAVRSEDIIDGARR